MKNLWNTFEIKDLPIKIGRAQCDKKYQSLQYQNCIVVSITKIIIFIIKMKIQQMVRLYYNKRGWFPEIKRKNEF